MNENLQNDIRLINSWVKTSINGIEHFLKDEIKSKHSEMTLDESKLATSIEVYLNQARLNFEAVIDIIADCTEVK